MFKVAVVIASMVVSTSLTAHQQTAENSVVMMNVTVTNAKHIYERNRGPVSGLRREAFTVYDNNVPQQIHFFTDEDTPASVGIVVDTSDSMITPQGKDLSMKMVATAVASFIEHSNRSNEYFLVTFGNTPQLAVDWTADGAAIVNAIASAKPGGGSQLLDACHLSVEKVSRGKKVKQVLVLITTGAFAKSKHSLKSLRDELRASMPLLYILNPPNTGPLNRPPREFQELAEDTGGRYLYSGNQSSNLLALHAELIATEIRRQYMIGFIAKDYAKGNKWHSITVKVNPGTDPARELKQLFTRSISGYWGN